MNFNISQGFFSQCARQGRGVEPQLKQTNTVRSVDIGLKFLIYELNTFLAQNRDLDYWQFVSPVVCVVWQ